ncbi:signal recognition particle receptor beta subunit-domain-containing protein [Globomyces pollinis-pini]|nr:signal recognition particle receptor beta subunit-domain-containing protein [Globomyces pollinis-pini]
MTNSIYLIIIIVALLIPIYLWYSFQKTKKNKVLLVGLCDAGKTTLFYKWTRHQLLDTCTSITENIHHFKQNNIYLVDLPGHEKLQFKLSNHLQSTKSLIFIIDATTFVKQSVKVAESLYNLLILSEVAKFSLPVVILCNKMDSLLAFKPLKIQQILESEINRLRKTRASDVANQADIHEEFLGYENEDFLFEHIPNKVEFIGVSVKNDDLDELRETILV